MSKLLISILLNSSPHLFYQIKSHADSRLQVRFPLDQKSVSALVNKMNSLCERLCSWFLLARGVKLQSQISYKLCSIQYNICIIMVLCYIT